MPVISVEIGPQTPEVKDALIRALTKQAVEITKIPAEFYMVLINELPVENIGLGGMPVKEYLAERAKAR